MYSKKVSLVNVYANSKTLLVALVCAGGGENARACSGGVKKSGLAMEKRGDQITDHFHRTELWRKTCNPERQALHQVLCMEPSGQYSIQLDLEEAPVAAPLL